MAEPEQKLVAETEFAVRYAETDAMGVVHHANYLVYFEAGRCHLLQELGSNYADLEAQGHRLPVTEVGVRYVGSLRYGQQVRIRTRLEENRSRRLSFAYEVLDPETGTVLVSGFTRHVWTDHDGRVTRMPAAWSRLLPAT